MRNWYVSRCVDDYQVHVVEAPWWSYAIARAVERLDAATGHNLCGSANWPWRIPLGRPVYAEPDEDGERFLENSLGGKLYDAFSWAILLPDRNETERLELKLTRQQALAAEPLQE